MNKMLISISFGALLAAVPALAQNNNNQNNNNNGGQAHPQHAQGGGHMAGPAAHPAGPGGHAAAPNHMAAPTGPMSGPVAAPHPAVNHAMTHTNGAHNGMAHTGGAAHSNGMAHSNAMANHGAMAHGNAMSHMGGMAHGNAPHADHSNFSALHRNFRAPHRFHAGSYHRPHGYYAHRWVFGEMLPGAFFAQNYWINDFSEYGLVPPLPGTVWVRYGSDALLIDQYTGEVIQVEYDVFY